MIEERFRKIENEELLRMFSINTVIGTQKLTGDLKTERTESERVFMSSITVE